MYTVSAMLRSVRMDRRRPRFIEYRRDLKLRARSLRGDPSPAERKLWYELLSKHAEKFTRQKPLGTYIADFYCAEKQLVIELDGDSHFTVRAEAYDSRRTSALQVKHLRVLRFTNDEVMQEFEGVCARIEEALAKSDSK